MSNGVIVSVHLIVISGNECTSYKRKIDGTFGIMMVMVAGKQLIAFNLGLFVTWGIKVNCSFRDMIMLMSLKVSALI